MKRKSRGTPSGFRDLMPQDVVLKSWLVKTISDVYQKYGFLPIETPIVEFNDTLMGEVTDFNLYKVIPSKERKTGNASELALRFDQTVPLARYVVDHLSELNIPFKRYVYGPVFRGETPQAGRYRQFDQFDVDIVGSSNIASDIEILLCMRDVMVAIVGEGNFTIRANTRKLLNALPKVFNFPEEYLRKVLIELDKKDKISELDLINSLIKIGLDEITSKNIIKFGSIKGSPDFVVKEIESYCGNTQEAQESIKDLNSVLDFLLMTKSKEIEFDMSIIRGLGYYTGMVFETTLNNAPKFGSVYSGGRYDELVSSFGIQQMPAVGASVGVDRLISALQSIDFKIPNQNKKIIILIQDKNVLSYAFLLSKLIRASGVICEVYTGNKSKLGDQFKYADDLGYDYTIVVGQNEMKDKTVNFKKQLTKEKATVSIENFISKIMV